MKARRLHLWSPAFTGFGGGITAFSQEFAMALGTGGTVTRLFGKYDCDALWRGLPLSGAGGWPGSLQTTAFAVRLLAAACKERPEAVFSTHLNFGPVARLVRQLTGTHYTLVAHGIDVHTGLSGPRLTALREADQILAVSEWTRQRLLALGGIADGQVKVLPNTYNDERFTVGPASFQLRKRHGIAEDEKVILTVARLEAVEGYKGYDRVLLGLPEVIRACGPVRLLIVGRGNDRSRLEKMAQEFGVADRVTFAGFVPDGELADYYRLADVFAMPSTGEGFGIVFLEAMGCGTPVLAGNQDGSVDALVGGELGLLVDPTSVEAIAAGLILLLQKQGPERWFDRKKLSAAVKGVYGRETFLGMVQQLCGVP